MGNRTRYADPKNDIAFKKIFGNEAHKEILISFLNAVLDFSGEKEIVDITIRNPYQIPEVKDLKETTLDVDAFNRKGTNFIIEMQVEKQESFLSRALYYAAKAYSSQIKVGEDYPKLRQVIFIGILNFTIFETEEYLSKHLIINTKTMKQSIKDMEFNFIELPKFNKEVDELDGVIEKWLYFIKNAENLDMVPESIVEKPIQEAYKIADMFMWTKEEYRVYDYWSIRKQDERGSVELARKEGREEGLQKGIEKMVINMHKNGIPVEQIAEMTGIDIDNIKSIVE